MIVIPPYILNGAAIGTIIYYIAKTKEYKMSFIIAILIGMTAWGILSD